MRDTLIGAGFPPFVEGVVVRSCDQGDDVCCNRITVSTDYSWRYKQGFKAPLTDLDVWVRVTRPTAICPTAGVCGPEDECYIERDDVLVMAERTAIMRLVPAAIATSCGTCCEKITFDSFRKLCGGKCGGMLLKLTFENFVFDRT